MQPLSVQLAPIVEPRSTTARSIVVSAPTRTPVSSTTRPPIRAPAPIRQSRSISADGITRPRFSVPSSTHTKPSPMRAPTAVATVPSRMSNVPSR